MLVMLVPCVASAVLIEALDFTGTWDYELVHAGGYALTKQMDGDPTKAGFEQNTTEWGAFYAVTEVLAPTGYTMSNVRVEALASGFSSWVMNAYLSLGTVAETNPLWLTHYVSTSQGAYNGVVVVDVPLAIDASGEAEFTGVSSVFVGTQLDKGLTSVWKDINISQIKVYADLTVIPEPSSIAMVAFAALAFLKRR